MTSSELVYLLREHPKSCRVLGVNVIDNSDAGAVCEDGIAIGGFVPHFDAFRRWLLGACVEEHVRRGWVMPMLVIGHGWHQGVVSDGDGEAFHPTILHAMLARIEREAT